MLARVSLLVGLFLAPVAYADSCPQHFPAGVAPTSQDQVNILCSTDFAVGFSVKTREAVWSAEHLTRQQVMAAEKLKGRGKFVPDTRLPSDEQIELDDYKRSGWSRGHLTPSGDMPTKETRQETFVLSNIVPQDTAMNAGVWAHIESVVRKTAEQDGEVWVLTGPAFHPRKGTIGKDRIPVPSSIWKVIYIPDRQIEAIIVCKNMRGVQCNAVDEASLQRVTGIDPFPGLRWETLHRSADFEKSLMWQE